MNILIIEDDIFLSQNIKKVFKKRVITNLISLVSSYEGFIQELPVIDSYDIILVDIKLKDLHHQNWIDIIQILRKKDITVPIVVISGFNDIELIEQAFSVGASDYISKPFRLKELEIRIMKWFKTYCMSLMFSHSQVIEYKQLTYKFNENEFYYKDDKIELTKKSKFILFQLLIKPEHLIRESILRDKLWWDRESIKERNLRVNILRLKKSLEDFWIEKWIRNKRWEWYVLKKK